MKLLEGKNVIITGASRRIGKGIAKVFADNGANVAFTFSSSEGPALELEKELSSKNLELLGAFVPAGLADEKNHEEGIQKALKVTNLMYSAGYKNAFIVLADNNGSIQERTKNACPVGLLNNKPGLS